MHRLQFGAYLLPDARRSCRYLCRANHRCIQTLRTQHQLSVHVRSTNDDVCNGYSHHPNIWHCTFPDIFYQCNFSNHATSSCTSQGCCGQSSASHYDMIFAHDKRLLPCTTSRRLGLVYALPLRYFSIKSRYQPLRRRSCASLCTSEASRCCTSPFLLP